MRGLEVMCEERPRQFSVPGTGVSRVRGVYLARLAGRCVIFFLCVLLACFRPEELEILRGKSFFRKFSPLHLLWAVWMFDMLMQLIPSGFPLSLGSQKLFASRFRPSGEAVDRAALGRYSRRATGRACLVLVLWGAAVAMLSLLRRNNVFNDEALFLVSVAFYVCDLICVLIWCPFRLLLGNRCCTTCRIFNWDHLMMFTPMLSVDGFYSRSLLLMAVSVFLVWELSVLRRPERFWEGTNAALRCSECTDKLCTQYCQGFFRKNKAK